MSCCRISGSLSFNSRLTSAAEPLGSPGAYMQSPYSSKRSAYRRFKIPVTVVVGKEHSPTAHAHDRSAETLERKLFECRGLTALA